MGRLCRKNIDEGYVYAVDMDLEKFFDTVCQSKLIEVLSRTIKDKDGRVISTIHKYLNAGVLVKGIFERTETGMPQGGPLSPLLSNIMLNELDNELERRGHKYVRYADDCMIFCKSRKSAQRTLENIIPFIEGKLFLKVNRKKTEVAHISKVKLADMKDLLKEMDEWARSRIRAVYWKQWKKVKTRYRILKAIRLEDWKARELANSRKGYWRMAKVLNQIFSNKIIAKLGYQQGFPVRCCASTLKQTHAVACLVLLLYAWRGNVSINFQN